MKLVRRTPRPAPKPKTTPPGEKVMRRVEVKGSPREPHWYVDCTTDDEAIHRVASAKYPADRLHVVKRGQ